MKLGRFEIDIISGGKYKLDGGAMFGVIPKPLWEKSNPADERNRVELDTNCLLIDSGDKKILVDTGSGTKYSSKEKDIFSFEDRSVLLNSLKAKGLGPSDIDIVIFSHLHFDHAGGGSIEAEGKVVPTFPRATYLVQKGEWDDAMNNYGVMKYSYRKENLIPLRESGQIEFIEGDYDVVPGLQTIVTGAHTRHHQIIKIDSEEDKGVYFADLIPTRSHLKLAFVMAYDLFPHETLLKKRDFLNQAAEEKWWIFFDHDPKGPKGKIIKESDDVFVIET
jgi:glyoxylase-like metal-dependent hydrolase (beta-lactamase superfamily II)